MQIFHDTSSSGIRPLMFWSVTRFLPNKFLLLSNLLYILLLLEYKYVEEVLLLNTIFGYFTHPRTFQKEDLYYKVIKKQKMMLNSD